MSRYLVTYECDSCHHIFSFVTQDEGDSPIECPSCGEIVNNVTTEILEEKS